MLTRVSGFDISCPNIGIHLSPCLEGHAAVVTYSSGGLICRRSLNDSEKEMFIKGDEFASICVFVVSACGMYAAFTTKSDHPDITYVSLSDGVILHAFEDYDECVVGLSFSHDGKYLFSFGENGRYFVFDLTDFSIASCGQFKGKVLSVVCGNSFVKDIKGRSTGVYCFATVGGTNLTSWKIDGALVSSKPVIFPRLIREYTCIAFMGNKLFAGTASGDVLRVDVSTGVGESVFVSTAAVCCLCACGDQLIVASVDGSLGPLGTSHTRVFLTSRVHSLAANGESLVAALFDGSLVRCENVGNVFASSLLKQNVSNLVSEICLCDGGYYTFSEKLVRWVSDKLGEVLYTGNEPLLCGEANSVLAIAGSSTGDLFGIDLNKRSLAWRISLGPIPIIKCDLSRNMQTAFVARGSDVILLDLRLRRSLQTFRGSANVRNLCFFADQDFALSNSSRSLSTWDLHVGKPLSEYALSGGISLLASELLEDQTTVVSSSSDRRIVVWDLRVRDFVASIPFCDTIECVSSVYSRPAILACGTETGSVLFWDVGMRETLKIGEWKHAGKVSAIAAQTESAIVSAGTDKCLFKTVWPQNGQHPCDLRTLPLLSL